jgi:Homeodomain-like domain
MYSHRKDKVSDRFPPFPTSQLHTWKYVLSLGALHVGVPACSCLFIGPVCSSSVPTAALGALCSTSMAPSAVTVIIASIETHPRLLQHPLPLLLPLRLYPCSGVRAADQLTTIERAAIITLHGVGWTGRDIADAIKCSEQTVSLWLNRWSSTHSLSDADRHAAWRGLDGTRYRAGAALQ